MESLTAARAAAMAGTEPSDGLRVSLHLANQHFITDMSHTRYTGCQRIVNTTRQTEAQKECSCNGHEQSSTGDRLVIAHPFYPPSPDSCICILDSAFVDRADIVQYIDLPPKEAIYQILRSCFLELIKRKLIQQTVRPLPPSRLFHNPSL